MELKKKIVSIGAAAVLASMMAVPAFAAAPAGPTDNNASNELTGQSPLGANMDINATVTDTTNIISVTVPTAIPVAIQTSDGTAATQGSFAGFKAPEGMEIQNHSYEVVSGDPFKIESKIKTVSDAMSLLADVDFYIGAGANGDSTDKVKLDTTAASDPAFVKVPAGTGTHATGITPGKTAIGINVADLKNGAKLSIVDQIGSDHTVAAPLQTMIYVSKDIS